MMSNSFASIKRGQAILTDLDVTETIAQEMIALANILEEETLLDFNQALSMIENTCDVILPGYQGVEKLEFFRNHIRNRFMNELIGYEEGLDHQDTINDARNAGNP